MQDILDNPVLVLNRLWQAVNICSARRAFNLLYQGHAQVVVADDDPAGGGRSSFSTHDFESWRDLSQRVPEPVMIHGVSLRIRVPRIIVLLLFDRLPKKEVKFTRHNIFERDGNTCQYCGRLFERSDLNLDHVLPRERGGLTTWENIVCSCIRCNTRKGNRLPHEAGMALIRKPKRPKWRPFIHLTFGSGHPHDESWKHFVDLAYWNVELSD
ncbi:MAG: HNH endonuclease [Verrucomicrobia bacterium]|nr:HNH endonuclease [Verrucomicrobiota bacterium]